MNDSTDKLYDEGPPQWDDMFLYSPAPKIRREKIVGWLQEEPLESILDVGCGNGAFLNEIGQALPKARLYGADISATAIEKNRSTYGNADFFVFNLNSDLPTRRFDAVVCTEVVEHCADYRKTIQKLADMTEKQLIITVPCGPLFEIDRRVGHLRHFRPAEIIEAVEAAGLTVTRSMAWGFPFFNLYKHLINVNPDKISSAFLSEKSYGFLEKLVSNITYATFKLCLPWKGYQLFVTANRTTKAKLQKNVRPV